MLAEFLQSIFRVQVRWCRWLDRRLFSEFSEDGNSRFVELVRQMVPERAVVADIGGGKTPFFSADEVAERCLQVVGVDVSADELGSAPLGCYQRCVEGAIEEVRGSCDCDVVIAQSVLEHVLDGRLAAEGVASFCRPSGVVVTFCPNRRAWFAQLNLILPEALKRWVLFSIFPEKRNRQGFPAYYDGCTAGEMRRNLENAGVDVERIIPFFTSSYFMFFVPLYLFWRGCTYPLMKLWPMAFCETFIVIGRKR